VEWRGTAASAIHPSATDWWGLVSNSGIGLGGILVIVGIVIAIFWSVILGIIIALIGLVAFGGFARGKWY
jgi:hypothetical protein